MSSANLSNEQIVSLLPTAPLQGFLFKQGPRENLMKRRWHKRWFFQKNMKLFYYTSKDNEFENGFIDMELCTGVLEYSISQFSLEVVTPKRVYRLRAPTEQSYKYWIKGLNGCLEHAKQIRALRPNYSTEGNTEDGETLPSEIIEYQHKHEKKKSLTNMLTFSKRNSIHSEVDNFTIERNSNLSSSSDMRPASIAPYTMESVKKSSSLNDIIVEEPVNNDKALDPRSNVAREILNTEKYYVHVLQTVISKYKTPLEKLLFSPSLLTQPPAIQSQVNELLTNENFSVLFHNIEKIAAVNTNICNQLEERIIFGDTNNAPIKLPEKMSKSRKSHKSKEPVKAPDNTKYWNNDSTCISDIFLKFIPELKLYGSYGKNYDDAMTVLQRFTKNSFLNETINQMDESTNVKPRLPDLLISPIQRIPRYRLLFLDFLKQTNDKHPDYQGILQVLTGLENLANELNDEIRLGNNNRKFMTANGKIASQLLSKEYRDRDLIQEGTLIHEVSKDKYKAYLFNDIVICLLEAKSKDKNNFTNPNYQFPLNLIWPKNTKEASNSNKNQFTIVFPKNNAFRLFDKEEREQWISRLEKSVDNLLSNEVIPPEYSSHHPTNGAITVESEIRFGKYTFPKGGTYQGWWKNGLRDGFGKFTYFEATYEGFWINDLKSGNGKMQYATGELYDGEWANDLPSGKGVLHFTNGDVYTGDFKDGKFHGKGEIKYQENSTYSGDWEFNLPHGEGEYISPRCSFSGQWKFGQRWGEGEFKSGVKSYKGEWKSDLHEGQGTYHYEDGSVYTGAWKAGQRSGFGKLEGKTFVYEGNWEKNMRDGKGTQINGDYCEYKGLWIKDQYDGKGKIKFSAGSIVEYDGEFAKGKMTGKGTAIFRDGSKYEGNWKANKMNGNGVLFDPQANTKITGKWKDGKMEGGISLMVENGNTFSGSLKGGTSEIVSGLQGRPSLLLVERPVFVLDDSL